MEKELIELLRAVASIESDIYDLIENDEQVYLLIESSSFACRVSFLGIHLWDSENDERCFDDEKGYEPLEPFLRKAINKELNLLKKITFDNYSDI